MNLMVRWFRKWFRSEGEEVVFTIPYEVVKDMDDDEFLDYIAKQLEK